MEYADFPINFNIINDLAQIVPIEKKEPCFHFHLRNVCRFGEHCRYRHDYMWQKKENDEEKEQSILQLRKENDLHLHKNEESKEQHGTYVRNYLLGMDKLRSITQLPKDSTSNEKRITRTECSSSGVPRI